MWPSDLPPGLIATPPQYAVQSRPRRAAATRGVSAGLGSVLEACTSQDIDLWFVDLTHLAIGVPVARALSTRLCHCKPRFARLRLTASDDRDLSADSADPG